jgi:hypothetical protein
MSRYKKTFKHHLPVIVLLTVAFLIGLFTVQDYGISWDEAGIFKYSKHLPGAYKYILNPQNFEPDNSNWILNLYGPAHFLYAELMSRVFGVLMPAWEDGTAQHFSYLITFLAGTLFLYLLLKEWVKEWAAFGAALLFISQPLFWGHALMNPKDMPFMAFFTASVYLGIKMVDNANWKRILVAGVVLGISTSIRSLSPMAGAIVFLYGMWKSPRKAIPLTFWYFLVSVIALYLTWPYLWKAPIQHYVDSIELMSQFPFDARVLFRGDLYMPNELPRSYVPVLFWLQFTEPVLALCIFGAVPILISKKKEPLFLVVLWFLLPILGILLTRSVLYDNARQIFFLLPPVFLSVGFALDFLNDRISSQWIKNILLVALILPGVFAIVRLHPYEYSYYNSFIGGIPGAEKKFETDYWGISFKEAMDYINMNAPTNARIMVLSGPDETAAFYARPDLQIITEETDYTPEKGYDYVLILMRKNFNAERCKKSETVYTIGREGVVFTYVNKLGIERSCK